MELVTLASATAATGLLVGGAGRLAIAGWWHATNRLQQLRFRSDQRTELYQQTQRVRLTAQAHEQNEHNAHSQWQVMQVVEIVDESLDVRSFYLQDPLNSTELADYKPGQFLTIRPALGGADLPARCYSLSDAPGQAWFRISVKRQPTTAHDHHSLSNWLHQHVRVGDCLLVAGPYGEFTIVPKANDQTPIVLLAAGIGVTPILSMLKSLLKANPSRSVHVYFQVQDDEHWPFGDLIHSWGAQCAGLKATTYFSRLAADKLPTISSGQVKAGKFTPTSILEDKSIHTGAQFYMCGPDEWMKSLADGFTTVGVAPENLHWESFASNSGEPSSDTEVDSWQVRFARSGLTSTISIKPTSILEVAAQQGLSLPSACHSGACGSCKLKLLKGTVTYARRPTCGHKDDEVVACVAQAVGNVEVDA